MDKCEAERNQITLAAVKALGEASLKCCMTDVLLVSFDHRKEVCESLLRSFEESNGSDSLAS